MRVVSAWRFTGPKESRECEPAIWLDGSPFWILTYRLLRWLWESAMTWEDWAARHCRASYLPGENGPPEKLVLRPDR